MWKIIKNRIKTMDFFNWVIFTIIFVYALSMCYIFLFGLLNSVKFWVDYQRGNVFGLPKKEYGWYFSNWIEVFTKFKIEIRAAGMAPRNVFMMEMFYNTVVYSGVVSFCAVAVQVMVAYAVAKYTFRLKNLIHITGIIVMMIPIVGSLASEYQIAQQFGLINSVFGVGIMRAKYPGMYYLVFYAMFKSIPWAYAEAAEIDGAGHWTIFFKIMIPMVIGTIFGVFILQFIAHSNEYTTPMLFTPLKPTLSYGLLKFQTSVNTGMSTPLKLAAALFSCIPNVALFLVFRNKIMGTVSIGGLKG